MKKLKTSIICTLLIVSAMVAIPTMAVSSPPDGPPGGLILPTDGKGMSEFPELMFGALGGIFGMLGGLGPSGAALGEVFKILFTNIFDFTFVEDEIKHVYKLSAEFEETESWNETHTGEEEYYFLWKEKYSTPSTPDVHPYVKVTRTGNVTVTKTNGAAVVFLIWDNNDSFITAINKVITAAQNVKALIEGMESDPEDWDQEEIAYIGQQIASQILSAITYLFFHINDIISGDELIVMNMITWETTNISTSSDYAVTKEYLVYDNDGDFSNDDTWSNVLNPADQAAWDYSNDDFMTWLMTPGEAGQFSREWSRLSFNLIELWFKTFQININVSAIVEGLTYAMESEGGDGNPFGEMGLAKVFHGLDIEIYLMTHSLMGFIAYDDVNMNDIPDVERTSIVEGNVTSEVITGSEARYWFALGSVGGVTFTAPELVTDAQGNPGYQWSIELTNVNIAAIPIGMSPSDIDPVFDNLDYIELGFTFTPKLKEVVTSTEAGEYSGLVPDYDEVQMAKGIIKLDQYFSDWNDGGAINPDLAGLDFAVIYVSTILHFRLHFEVNDISVDVAQDGMLNETVHEASINGEGTIKVGDYTGDLPVAAVDIAGPDYEQGPDGGPTTTHPASTCTIPLAFLAFDASANIRYEDPGNPTQSFEAGGYLNISSSILIYAVSYPTFNGSGEGIWHDPTFSVFMTWDNPGFWAVILVVAGITLVAVAAILITRRKNRI
jgi:hypothetical protein